MKITRIQGGFLGFVLVLFLLVAFPISVQAQPTAYTGKLSDGLTDYNFLVPEDWNGTLLVSLDTLRPGTVQDWLIEHGYALAGTARGPAGWNLTYASENVIEAMEIFEEMIGTPDCRVVWGRSRGGITTRAIIQLFPDRFDGALPMCGGGAGTVAMWSFKLDAAFALDVLLGTEYGIRLKLTDIDNAYLATEIANINAIVNQAQLTPQGRARVALAGALSQISTWNSPAQTEPAKDDYDLQQANVAESIGFALGTSFIPFLEGLAGGPFLWNHGIDYRVQLAHSGYMKMVYALYKKAGLSLKADLRKLNDAPRLYADPDAVDFIEKHNMTWTGDLQQPVLSMTTTGDAAGPISDERAYADVVRYAGKNKLLRSVIVHRGGHCNFTDAEQIAAFMMLFQRIETGKWYGNASAHAMTKLAEEIQAETAVDLGETNFVNAKCLKPLRTWDVRDWDTYDPGMDE